MAYLDLQNRSPTVTRTPDFRNHVERIYDVLNFVPKTPAQILAACWLPLGTLDEQYTDCYLIEQRVEGQQGDSKNPCGEPPKLIRVFEQLNGLNETQIGAAAVEIDQYGDQIVTFTYWQLNVGTAIYQVPGTTAAPAPFTSCILRTEQRTNDGTLRKIVRAYTTGGILSDNERLMFGGKLLMRELKYLNQVPPTPSGYTLTTHSTEFVSGLPVYTYGFAKPGSDGLGGGIGQSIHYGQSIDLGVTAGTTVTTLKFVTDQTVTTNPFTAPSGTVLIDLSYEDDAGYRLWTGVYAKGVGLVAEEIHSRQDGLREVTDISLGTKVTPSGGVVIRDDYENRDGFIVYTVTAIQALSGGAPTGGGMSFERYVPFLYPGRAKPYNLTAANGWVAYDVFQSPPVSTQVKATITVSYQTSNSLGTITDYWNPSEWATIRAEWIGQNNLPGFAILALPGYRSTNTATFTFTASSWAGGIAGTMLGNIVYGGTTAILNVTGGPADPGGTTKTLDATIEPAFTSVAGTVYYRKTIVSAAIPAQAALPV